MRESEREKDRLCREKESNRDRYKNRQRIRRGRQL